MLKKACARQLRKSERCSADEANRPLPQAVLTLLQHKVISNHSLNLNRLAIQHCRREASAEGGIFRYDHFTGGRFRHGTKFLRWRPDKKAEQCKLSQVK